jgi:hypothetical protein
VTPRGVTIVRSTKTGLSFRPKPMQLLPLPREAHEHHRTGPSAPTSHVERAAVRTTARPRWHQPAVGEGVDQAASSRRLDPGRRRWQAASR